MSIEIKNTDETTRLYSISTPHSNRVVSINGIKDISFLLIYKNNELVEYVGLCPGGPVSIQKRLVIVTKNDQKFYYPLGSKEYMFLRVSSVLSY